MLAGSGEESRRAVHAVAVAERHGGETGLGALTRELFRRGRTAQKRESAAGMEFDVGHRVNVSFLRAA